jgi:hypothetical protein
MMLDIRRVCSPPQNAKLLETLTELSKDALYSRRTNRLPGLCNSYQPVSPTVAATAHEQDHEAIKRDGKGQN